jgi:hypothetical protein
MKKLVLLAMLCLLAPATAHAAFIVSSPRVSKGIMEIEAKNAFGFDDVDTRQHVLEVEYGFTDWMALSLEGEWEKENPRGYEYTASALEATVLFTEPGQYWLDAGAKLEYEFSHESQHADKIEAMLLLEKQINKFSHTANFIIEREVGDYSSGEYEGGFAWRTAYGYSRRISPAIEYYAEFGEIDDMPDFDSQEHSIGPAIYGHLGSGIKYDLGLLFGISDGASDQMLKLNLEYEFPI